MASSKGAKRNSRRSCWRGIRNGASECHACFVILSIGIRVVGYCSWCIRRELCACLSLSISEALHQVTILQLDSAELSFQLDLNSTHVELKTKSRGENRTWICQFGWDFSPTTQLQLSLSALTKGPQGNSLQKVFFQKRRSGRGGRMDILFFLLTFDIELLRVKSTVIRHFTQFALSTILSVVDKVLVTETTG